MNLEVNVCSASLSDNVVYAFMVENPNGSNLLHQDLEQILEDDLEAMDLNYDKTKVECFNCHKLGHFARECRLPRNKDGQYRYQDNTRKQGNNEDTSSKEMLAIDGVGFDWSDMAEEQVQTNMALMVFSDSENNCPHHQRKGMVNGNNYNRVDYDYYAKTIHPSSYRSMPPRAVLLKSGLTPINTARPIYTAHPKPTVHSARSMTHFSKQAQSTVQRPFYKKTALTNKTYGVNAVKTSACWVWRPTRPNGASLIFKRHNYIDARGRSKSVGDEAVHKELGDSMEMAVTTASSLEVEQDSDAQTWFEAASKQSNDLPLSRGYTLRSGEDSMKLIELMASYTKLSELDAAPMPMTHLSKCSPHLTDDGSLSLNELMDLVTKLKDRVKVLDTKLQQTKNTYSTALTKLILRVKKLENNVKSDKPRRRARIVILDDERCYMKQKYLADAARKRGKYAGEFQEKETSTPSPAVAKDKGKAIMQEPEPPKKIKKKDSEKEKDSEKKAEGRLKRKVSKAREDKNKRKKM
ncbi:ribonuclease H-like domain-containing protein [Tanacetum coccineum]|uniref:Ribonuclease H-like domain-containing protein n=1 Tax=Tanacetum coccineum TaxID=301880 RepID=A0ABQ5E188_9ASTR